MAAGRGGLEVSGVALRIEAVQKLRMDCALKGCKWIRAQGFRV
jgi:hypothetical protein